ncbi:MAG: T9SS type A sorting domain-containing protein, partial [bacterium]
LKYTLTTGIKENGQIPASFNLEQNYPNPFDSETKISYSLAIPAQVQLTVCNMFGQQVALLDEGFKPAGSFSADFKGDGLPSGIYYYRLQCGDRHETRKMTLIK